MLDAIREARREVLLETYIWADDGIGRRFVEAVTNRAGADVTVQALVDGFGSLGFLEDARRRLREGGVELAVFHPVRPWRPRWAWSVRDHRKLLVVDGAVGFTGSLNIGDDYAPAEWGGRNWYDVHVQIRGPAVDDLRGHFISAWLHATRQREAPAPSGAWGSDGNARVAVLGVAGFRGRRRIRKHYHFAIRQAQRQVRIMAGYFIPDRGWRRVLRNAVRRGVDVAVIFPHTSDVPAVLWAARATYGPLLRAGVRIYEWTPSMMHAKVLSVDGAWCAIGSYNLDQRSLLLNWELSVSIGDSPVPSTLDRHFEESIEHCLAIDPTTWKRRGLWPRILERSFYTLRRWL